MRTKASETATNRGLRPVVLLTIYGPSETLRLSNTAEPYDVAHADIDATYQYIPGIYDVIDYTSEVDVYALTAQVALQSARLDIAFPDLDIATEEGTHYGLTGARAELALHWAGDDWEARIVILDGAQVAALEVGIDGEPSTLALENGGPPAGKSPIVSERDIGADFPTSGFTDLDGKQWPIVIGKCYGIPGFKLGEVNAGSLALGICGHAIGPGLVVASFTLRENGATVAAPTSLQESTDSTGAISYFQNTGTASSDPFGTGKGAYTIDCPNGAIACARNPGRIATTAADVLEWLLVASGVLVDWDAMRPCLRFLQDWTVGIYLDKVCDALKVIRDRLCPVLPIIEVSSARGLYFLYADPTVHQPATTLTYGQELAGRLSRVVYVDLDEIRNVFVVEYGWGHYIGRYRERVQVDATNNELCRYSQQLYGERVAEVLRADCVWDDTTAYRIAMLAATRRALPRRLISYALDPSMYWLQPPTVVRLADTAAGFDSIRAVTRSVRPFGDPFSATFEALDRAPSGLL